MRTILANDITQAVREACIEGCCVLPAPVVQALMRAKEQERGAAKAILEQLLENARLAREAMRPCCQDTGMAVAFVELGQEVHIQGNLEAAGREPGSWDCSREKSRLWAASRAVYNTPESSTASPAERDKTASWERGRERER